MIASESQRVWITECPRDAMQGIREFIPTETKAAYLNQLLKVGFDVLDFGSFVSPKAIPQLQDTKQVLELLEVNTTETRLLAIVANERGAKDACSHAPIHLIGYPFSISESFQFRNTNNGIGASFETVQRIIEHCAHTGKDPLIYISMAFGNPYGDPWNIDIALGWVSELYKAGIKKIALADTVGIAKPEDIGLLTKSVLNEFPGMETGVHLHCHPGNWREKTEAAYSAGCRRFDTAIKGLGGCPMAEDELVGNLATENLLQYLNEKNVTTRIQKKAFETALFTSGTVFLVH
jgi:hydroxymethylglutaryl-CoA lyase